MAQSTADIGRQLVAMCGTLADAVIERQAREQPGSDMRGGYLARQQWRDDIASHVAHLGEAMVTSQPVLFREYVAWAKVMQTGRGMPSHDLTDSLRMTTEVLKEQLAPEAAAAASRYIDAAITDIPQMATAVPTCLAPDQPLADLADAYLAALLALDRQTASSLILDAVQNGASIKDVYIHVFQKAQEEIGRLWQMNEVTVAQEHYCTASTQMIMSQLYPKIFCGPRLGRTFVGACVGGDLHEIGMRMVADFFEMDGWDTLFLGSSASVETVISALQERQPDVVGISVTLTPHIGRVTQLIAAIRGAPNCGNVKIIVGGYPFLLAPDLWKQVGADGTCCDAQGVVGLANRLIKNEAAA